MRRCSSWLDREVRSCWIWQRWRHKIHGSLVISVNSEHAHYAVQSFKIHLTGTENIPSRLRIHISLVYHLIARVADAFLIIVVWRLMSNACIIFKEKNGIRVLFMMQPRPQKRSPGQPATSASIPSLHHTLNG